MTAKLRPFKFTAQTLRFFPLRLDWSWLAVAIALVLSLPIWVILSSWLTATDSVWQHLGATVLPIYLKNSFWLLVGVSVGTAVIGTGTAWLVTMCRFPGQWLFGWALLLPLAAPAYILAYVYTELLAFYGPVQSGLRQIFGWVEATDYWFPNVRSLPGAIVMLTLVLYPYVYLLARSAFLSQSVCMLEASRSLGCGAWRGFWAIALPLARPAVMAGLALVCMETLNDFGTVQFFAVDTFTTGIYRTWFGMGERIAAAQLAACLLLLALALVGVERWSRGRARYYQRAEGQQLSGYKLQGMRALAALAACLIPVSLGFLLPGGILLSLVTSSSGSLGDRFWEYAIHSLILALLTAGLAVLLAIVLAYGLRLQPSWAMRLSVQLAAIGYAVPGSVIAVGILVPMGTLDNAIDAWMQKVWGVSTGLLLSGTISALIFAYLVRFLAVSLGAVESSLTQIKPSLDEAARSLGQNTLGTLTRVHVPLLRRGLLTAAMLVFVDAMKELPATLIIRPFNFDTLAVRVYNLASDERLVEAAGPALAIVLVGLLPVMALSMAMGSPFRAGEPR